MDGYITKNRKISWLPRPIPSLEHETLPLSLGQHKAKTQPRQLTNMIADISRLPHSSFDSSQLLPIIPINSTSLSSHRPHAKKKEKNNLSRYASSMSSSPSTFSPEEFVLCQIYIGTRTWVGEFRNHVSLLPVATTTAE